MCTIALIFILRILVEARELSSHTLLKAGILLISKFRQKSQKIFSACP